MKNKYRPLLIIYDNLCLLVDVFLLVPWVVMAVLRLLARREPWGMIKERFGFLPHHHRAMARAIGAKKIIWLHAPSLGEMRSLLPLMTGLQKNIFRRDVFFIITCQSPSARQALQGFLSESFPDNNFCLSLAPFDNLWLLKNAWRRLRPTLFMLGESDFMPRRATWLMVKKTPSILLNGRMSKKSYIFFNIVFIWKKIIFSHFDILWAQSPTSQTYLARLSGKNVSYQGNLKLFKKTEQPKRNLVEFYQNLIPHGKTPLLLSCLHGGEDKLLFALYKKFPELKKYFFVIIVPRHPTQMTWKKYFSLRAAPLSLGRDNFFIVSSFGHLPSLYHLCPLVLLGGSWVRRGGHNPKEALDQGCMVLHGRYIDNASDIYTDTDRRRLTHLAHDLDDIYKKIIWFKKMSTTEKQQLANRAKKWQGDQRLILDTIIADLSPLIANALTD